MTAANRSNEIPGEGASRARSVEEDDDDIMVTQTRRAGIDTINEFHTLIDQNEHDHCKEMMINDTTTQSS